MNRSGEIIKVSYKGIAVNVILVIFKAVVGLAAHSISVILDAVNNLSDALSSVITIVGTKLAGKAPDKEHPYGHGRIEYVTSSIIAIIVLAAGAASLKESVEKIIEPTKPEFTFISVIVIVAGILTKFALGRYFSSMGRKLNSGSLTASGTDASFDAVISIGTLASAIIVMSSGLNIEGWLGTVISVFIIKAGIEIMRDTLNNIIGVRFDSELTTNVKKTINSFDEVYGCYDLLLHSYGPEMMLGSVHIEINDEMTARQIDELARSITAAVYKQFGVILTIGIYASNVNDEHAKQMKDRLKEIIADYDKILEMHGFYVDSSTNAVTFDLIFDFDDSDPKKTCEAIKQKMKADFPENEFFITIDRDFSD